MHRAWSNPMGAWWDYQGAVIGDAMEPLIAEPHGCTSDGRGTMLNRYE